MKSDSEIEGLLPWHAVEALDRSDAKRVEEALANDPELARRYAMVRDELDGDVLLNETLGAPSGQATARLFTKIDAEPARKQAVSLGLGTRVSEFFASFSPRTLAWSAAAAAIAILLQAAVIADIVIKDDGASYQTASAPATDAGAGTVALIRFAALANSGDITRFLEANKLQVVAGPMSGGFYKVRIATAALPKDEVARTVKTLQQDKVIDLIATTE
jgi:anti-sigma factor RsiW